MPDANTKYHGAYTLFPFPPESELRDLIQLAKREDLGQGDVTSRLLIPEDKIGVGTLMQKENRHRLRVADR